MIPVMKRLRTEPFEKRDKQKEPALASGNSLYWIGSFDGVVGGSVGRGFMGAVSSLCPCSIPTVTDFNEGQSRGQITKAVIALFVCRSVLSYARIRICCSKMVQANLAGFLRQYIASERTMPNIVYRSLIAIELFFRIPKQVPSATAF